MGEDITALVRAAGGGDNAARDKLFTHVYDELKVLARAQLRSTSTPTLNTTGLVHDAYLKLACPGGLDVQGRKHFFVLSARAMRQIVIDHVRRRCAEKRGGGVVPAALDDIADPAGAEIGPDKLLELDRALDQLQSTQPRLAALIELRFFGGLELAEIAEMQGVSERTLNRDWRRARAELYAVLYP